MSTKTPPDFLRKKLGIEELFPCEGKEASVGHVKKYKTPSRWVKWMYGYTLLKRECRWVSCPAYADCDLLCWGGHNPQREDSEDMIQKMMIDFTAGRGPFSSEEHTFLLQLLERLETDEHFIPTERQKAWLTSLYDRWTSRKM